MNEQWRVEHERGEGNAEFIQRVAVLAEIEILDGPERYIIPSSDGSRKYTVAYSGCADGWADTWQCDCPAGQHGRECKHYRLAMSINNHINNELGF